VKTARSLRLLDRKGKSFLQEEKGTLLFSRLASPAEKVPSLSAKGRNLLGKLQNFRRTESGGKST